MKKILQCATSRPSWAYFTTIYHPLWCRYREIKTGLCRYRVTAQLNLAYAAHCAFYTSVSQTLAQTDFLPFWEIPFLSLLPFCLYIIPAKVLRISNSQNSSKLGCYLQTSWNLGEDSILFWFRVEQLWLKPLFWVSQSGSVTRWPKLLSSVAL